MLMMAGDRAEGKLEEPTRTDWVKMRVAWRSDYREAGVLFPESCPDDFYLAVTLGINPASAVLREPSTAGSDQLD